MSAVRRTLRLLLLLVLLALAVVGYLFDRLQHPPVLPGPAEVALVFPAGTPTWEIFHRLEREGVVENGRIAELYYRLTRSASALQAGEYRFERPMPVDDVIDRMVSGDVIRHTVVVAEGLTSQETFDLFLGQGIGSPKSFARALKSTELLPGIAFGVPDLEGFLFPDTYVATRSTTARQIVEMMTGVFHRHFTPDLREKAQAARLSAWQAVILASIVQKETGLTSEARTIAGVYWNRLRRRIRLQADPTVVYALKKDGKWTGTLYRSDYAYDSPYNTYLNDGLPPGPICNPGLAAIQAAAGPEKTPYLYFVADTSGRHVFSKTFEEHVQATATIRRARAAEAAGEPKPNGEIQGPRRPAQN
ncbi:MAG: endolytic transglycosylase MltG [Thermoanaerobaculia bacterium]